MLKAVVVLTLLGLLGLQAKIIKVPVDRVESFREKSIREGTWEEYLKNTPTDRYHGHEGAQNFQDVIYISTISLGTPQQKFKVILDTGSANLWVPDSSCTGSPCRSKSKFQADKSSTFVADGRPWSIRYGTGSATGVFGIDSFCFNPDDPQLCVKNQTFGQANSIADFFAREPFDSICGLAFKSLAVGRVTPPFETLIPTLDAPIFTVWFSGNQNAGQRSGEFTFGGLDPDHCAADVTYVPLSAATYWQFKIDGVSTGSFTSTQAQQVISDTGTSLIGGPAQIVAGLAKEVGATFSAANQLYFISCSTANKPDVTFTINGKAYPISAKNYIVPSGNGFTCIFAFFPFGGVGATGPAWILGDPFIREYCQVYDYGQQRIGFSKATAS